MAVRLGGSQLVYRFKDLEQRGFKTGAIVESVYGPEEIVDITFSGDEVTLRECNVTMESYTGRRISFEQFMVEYKLASPIAQTLYGNRRKKTY